MKPLIVANWKCNPATLAEAKELFNKVVEGIKNACPEPSRRVEIVICPPFMYLSALGASAFAGGFSGLYFGSQDCCWQGEGAYTGEVSARMAKDAGCTHIIIGHSERRKHFGETDEVINKKVKAALEAGLLPILCVGETREERESGKTEIVLERQLQKGLQGIAVREISKIVIAYEPVWAISDGDPYKTAEMPTPENIKKAGIFIKDILSKIYGSSANAARIIYGGSANAANSKEFLEVSDGLLVGGASLKAEEFVKIVKSIQ